jgi:hypothetical protein
LRLHAWFPSDCVENIRYYPGDDFTLAPDGKTLAIPRRETGHIELHDMTQGPGEPGRRRTPGRVLTMPLAPIPDAEATWSKYDGIVALAYSADGLTLTASYVQHKDSKTSRTFLAIWSFPEGRWGFPRIFPSSQIAIRADGQAVAVGELDGRYNHLIRIISRAGDAFDRDLERADGVVDRLEFSPDGGRLLVSGREFGQGHLFPGWISFNPYSLALDGRRPVNFEGGVDLRGARLAGRGGLVVGNQDGDTLLFWRASDGRLLRKLGFDGRERPGWLPEGLKKVDDFIASPGGRALSTFHEPDRLLIWTLPESWEIPVVEQ